MLGAMASSGGRVVCPRLAVADRPLARMRGLLGRSDIEPDEGLLLKPAASVHTAFMRFPIDVVFLDASMRVLDVRSGLPPWRLAACPRAKAVLEMRAGEAVRRGVVPGARVMLHDRP